MVSADPDGVPSVQRYVDRALPPRNRRGAAPSGDITPICVVTPALRFTDVAVFRAQCAQSAVPSAVRSMSDGVAPTEADRMPLSPVTVSVTSTSSWT